MIFRISCECEGISCECEKSYLRITVQKHRSKEKLAHWGFLISGISFVWYLVIPWFLFVRWQISSQIRCHSKWLIRFVPPLILYKRNKLVGRNGIDLDIEIKKCMKIKYVFYVMSHLCPRRHWCNQMC